MTTPPAPTFTPRRGEVWLLDLTGGGGAEIDKIRPAVVVSSDYLKGGLPLKTVVPITEWNEAFRGKPWHVHLLATSTNGLAKNSSADAKQVRSVSQIRFQKRLGVLRATELQEIVSAIAIVIEYK